MGYDVILVDSRNMVFRHGYTRALLSNSEGTPTGAIFGALSCLIRLNRFHPKAKFIFCWDGKHTFKSWRNTMCDTYKANRRKPGDTDVPKEVTSILCQIPAIEKVIDILGFPQYKIDRLEADDLIGILAKSLSKKKEIRKVLIYSMDKDMFGLIDDKIQVVRDLVKSNDCKAYCAADVKKDYGVSTKNWPKYRALIGDPSDGIKSPFPKIGKVRALKLLAEGLDPSHSKPVSKLERSFKEHWNKAYMNYRLSKIVTTADSKVLTNLNRLQLAEVIDAVSTDDGVRRRNRKRFDAKGYKEFIQFCSTYELNWILENRHIYYRMGW